MKPSRLGPLQRDILEAFFRKERRFFLSGGAALAGFHLGHRETDDLELFVTEDVLDLAEEIMANKLCTLLARAEVRDLVDLQALEGSGLALPDALNAGARKDRGLTPAQLAWVLSEIRIGDDARLPGGVAVSDLKEYLRGLIERLSRLALPARPPERGRD